LTEYRDVVLDMSAFDGPLREHRAAHARDTGNAVACVAQGRVLNRQIDEMKNLGTGDCTRCGQPITPEHIAKEVADLEVQRDSLRVDFQTHDAAAKQAQETIDRIEADRAEHQRLHVEAERENTRISAESRVQLGQIKQSEDYLSKAVAHTAHLQKTMADTQAKVNPWLDREAQHQNRISELRANIEAMADERSTAGDKEKYIAFWIQGFGPKGLKNYILDSKLQEMTDAANQWVKLITGGTIWVKGEFRP
ncbi:unnamed protein product, partial [marine sediment metagenome]